MTPKNNFDENKGEYLHELATILNSSLACLQIRHCRWGDNAVIMTTNE